MRMRITVKKAATRAEDLRIAADVRRDLWAHSPVEIDPDNPLHSTHRDEEGRAYFEFSTRYLEQVHQVLEQYGHVDLVEVSEAHEPLGEACQRCGNIAGPVLPSVCPNCGFRDISPCPSCGREVPRMACLPRGGRLHRCPHCRTRVRMRFNDPLVHSDGSFNEPLVVVEDREVHRT